MFFLKKRDLIDIVATGRRSNDIDISKCIEFIESWGYRARFNPDSFDDDYFYASCDHRRHKIFADAVYNEDSKAIWCLRGGYGTTRVLSMLDHQSKPKIQKTIIGLSDCTASLLYAYKNWGWSSIHGSVLYRAANKNISEKSLTCLKEMLEGRVANADIDYGKFEPVNLMASHIILEKGSINRPIVGGNLCLLQSSIGTCWQPDLNNHLLFMEDIDETEHRTLERLHHLRTSGMLSNCAGLIIFDFTSTNDQIISMSQKLLDRIGDELQELPIFKGTGVGHAHESLPIMFGKEFLIN